MFVLSIYSLWTQNNMYDYNFKHSLFCQVPWGSKYQTELSFRDFQYDDASEIITLEYEDRVPHWKSKNTLIQPDLL